MMITDNYSRYYVPTPYGTVVIFGPHQALINPAVPLRFLENETWPQFRTRVFDADPVGVYAGSIVEPDPDVAMLRWARRTHCKNLDAIGNDVVHRCRRLADGIEALDDILEKSTLHPNTKALLMKFVDRHPRANAEDVIGELVTMLNDVIRKFRMAEGHDSVR